MNYMKCCCNDNIILKTKYKENKNSYLIYYFKEIKIFINKCRKYKKYSSIAEEHTLQ